MTLILCGLTSALTGVVFSLVSFFKRGSLGARFISRHLLLFSGLCLVSQSALHC